MRAAAGLSSPRASTARRMRSAALGTLAVSRRVSVAGSLGSSHHTRSRGPTDLEDVRGIAISIERPVDRGERGVRRIER